MRGLRIVIAAIATLIATSARADNFCTAVVFWDSSKIYGWHRAEATDAGYTNWDAEGTLKRSGVLVDDVEWSDDVTIHETQTSKINCNVYRAQTTAAFTGSGVTTELCGDSDTFILQMGGNCH